METGFNERLKLNQDIKQFVGFQRELSSLSVSLCLLKVQYLTRGPALCVYRTSQRASEGLCCNVRRITDFTLIVFQLQLLQGLTVDTLALWFSRLVCFLVCDSWPELDVGLLQRPRLWWHIGHRAQMQRFVGCSRGLHSCKVKIKHLRIVCTKNSCWIYSSVVPFVNHNPGSGPLPVYKYGPENKMKPEHLICPLLAGSSITH